MLLLLGDVGDRSTSKSDPMSSLEAVVASLRQNFEADERHRSAVVEARDKAESAVRDAHRHISEAHSAADVRECASRAISALSAAGEGLAAVEKCVPKDAYFRFHDMWRRSLQESICVGIVAQFLGKDSLADAEALRAMLGGEQAPTVPLEDYLLGACNAISEIARLCMNRVTVGDFETPARCASFGATLYDAFKLLNFRNDILRKRFDGIKYDVKRMEEITYDMAIRGLLPKATDSADVNMKDTDGKETKPAAE